MQDAREVLAEFLGHEAPRFIACDRRALDSAIVASPRMTTDIYLADLAAAHGWRLATLDQGITHPVADVIPEFSVKP